MALFKIEKGLADNLTAKRKSTVEGYCYFTIDDGKFYIDTATGNDLTKRVCLNAHKADIAEKADTADKLSCGQIGNSTKPVYFSTDGIPVPITYEIKASVPANAKFTDTIPSAAGSALGLVKSGGDVTISAGVITVNNNSHTHTIANITNLQTELDKKANKGAGIFYIEGTKDDNGTAGVWLGQQADITKYYNGLTIAYKIPVEGASTTTLKINALDAITVKMNNNTALTTHYPVNSVLLLTYTTDNGVGYWKIANYDSDTKVTQASTTGNANYHLLMAYSTNIKTSTASTTRKNASLYYNPASGILTAPKFSGTFVGTADKASAFATAQSITLEGDVNGTSTSTGGWLISTVLSTTGVAAGSYGLASAVTPAFGASFNVPYITVDAKGRITSASTYTVKLPANPNVDTGATSVAFSGSGNALTNVSYNASNRTLTFTKATLNNYTLPLATNSVRGGVKIGYSQNGKNYPVQLSNEQMFVNVPWTDNNTTYSIFGKATSSTSGTTGLVPAPAAGSQAKFLRGDGTWATPTNTTYTAGTGLTLSGTTFLVNSADASEIMNQLGEGTAPAQQDDYLIAQYAGGGTTTTTYHRRKVSNIITADNVKKALGTGNGTTKYLREDGTWYTPPNTTYTSLPNPKALTVGSKTYNGASAVTISAADLGLTGAMRLIGSTTQKIKEGDPISAITLTNGTSVTPVNGDVILYNNAEYVVVNDGWELLGDEGSYKIKQTAVSSPSASGNATAFIDTISQDVNGVITVTKKNVQTMGAATSSAAGKIGLVPAPAAGKQNSFLRGDGTWVVPTNTTYSAATTSASGLMTAAMVTKLNGIATGAEVNQNAFSNIVVDSTTISADSKTDSLTLVAGSNVTITPDAINDKITIAATDTKYGIATSSTAGLVKSGTDITVDENGNVSVNDNSHSHTIANITNLQTTLNGKLSLTGGTMTGNLIIKGTNPCVGFQNSEGTTKGYVQYIQSSDTYAFGAGPANSLTVTNAGSIKIPANQTFTPGITNTGSIGTSSAKWNAMYATTFNGDLSGNATTATTADKVKTSLAIKLNSGTTESTNLFTFDGSAAKTVNITPANIGAAPKSHASTGTTYGKGTSSNYGHVKLADAVNSNSDSSSGVAATPLAVKTVYDNAAIKTNANTFTNENTFENTTIFKGDIVLNAATYGSTTPDPEDCSPGQLFFVEDNSEGLYGLPSGGEANQILVKASDSDGHATWQNFDLNPQYNALGVKSYLLAKEVDSSYPSVINFESMIYSQNGNLYANKVYGAVWNDYAEYRNQKEIIEPGYCVASTDDGKIYKTTNKLQACDGIVSDTFGFAIGETDNCKTPLAVAGRVLAYYEGNREDYHAGDTVCAGPEGKVCKMTREEIREWPDRIIGIVSEVPQYDTWGTNKIQVNNRIWIKVK